MGFLRCEKRLRTGRATSWLAAVAMAVAASAQAPGDADAAGSRAATAQLLPRRAVRLGATPPALEELRLRVAAPGGFVAGVCTTFGVAFAEEHAVRDLGGLVVLDAEGRVVPSQWKALARYDGPREDAGRPVRFAALTVQAADTGPIRATYRLRRRAAGDPVFPELAAESAADATTVDVGGATRFVVPHASPAVLAAVVVAGRDATAGPVELIFEGADAEPVAPSFDAPRIEERGPLRVVVVRRGRLGALRCTLRAAFHAGSHEVVLDVRLENPAAYGLLEEALPDGEVHFERFALRAPPAGDGPAVATLAALPKPVAASVEAPFRVVHRRGGDVKGAARESVAAWVSSAVVFEGAERALFAGEGGAAAFGRVGGPSLAVAVERCAENAPKEISFDGAAATVELFPAWGAGPAFEGRLGEKGVASRDARARTRYRFEGGRWKTHRLALRFSDGPPTAASATAAQDALDRPRCGGVLPAQLRAIGALPGLWAERGASADGSALRYERFVDLLVDDGAADPFPRGERVGLRRLLARGGVYGGRDPTGWENFGDLPWAEGWSSLHYDWALHPALAFARSGDPRFFAVARDLAGYRRDYGQNHGEDPREWWRGANFYEKGAWHGDARPGQASHFWMHGLLLWYALSGDEGAYEAALQAVDFARRQAPGDWNGRWGSRIPGWTIHALVDAAAYLGDPRDLAAARAGVARYEEHESASGGRGYVLNPADDRTSPWMECILFNAAARYVAESGDASPLPLLRRMRDWLVRDTLVLSDTAVPHTFSHWAPGRPTEPSTHLLWPLVEALSWSAILGVAPGDDALARRLFDVVCCRWQSPPGAPLYTAHGEAPCDPVTFRPAMFPGSESKALGNL
ncbi:MAG TPA: hypothetical protein VEI02_12840, partial [Planctomycetota bacterium]|nr:hypothetical protein [Planctomycetota bacterium]